MPDGSVIQYRSAILDNTLLWGVVTRRLAGGRADAAARLHALADELARANDVTFVRDGKRFTVDVPDEVHFSFEVEIGDDGTEIEVELTW